MSFLVFLNVSCLSIPYSGISSYQCPCLCSDFSVKFSFCHPFLLYQVFAGIAPFPFLYPLYYKPFLSSYLRYHFTPFHQFSAFLFCPSTYLICCFQQYIFYFFSFLVHLFQSVSSTFYQSFIFPPLILQTSFHFFQPPYLKSNFRCLSLHPHRIYYYDPYDYRLQTDEKIWPQLLFVIPTLVLAFGIPPGSTLFFGAQES
jgi:hypothetical protein